MKMAEIASDKISASELQPESSLLFSTSYHI
jgi:hypothetical protein